MLPYQTRVFDSALEMAQARARLQDSVEPLPRPWRAPTARFFEGVVEGDAFRIHRIVRGRNSFRPELHGRIEATPAGRARVVVSFRPHPLVAVFMAAWLALGLLMPLIFFPLEARKAARFLEEVFGARAT